MSVFLDISAALDGHLNTMTSAPPVAWANIDYTPTVGTLYVRPSLLPADTIQATLGDSGTDMNQGIYQIDVFAPANKGKNEAMVMADLIANRFKRGTDLAYNGRNIRVKSVSQAVATVNPDGYFQVPVKIIYISFTEART